MLSLNWVVGFVGLAVLYGILSSLAILSVMRMVRRFPGWRMFPLLATTLSFVFMTQHPFPSPETLTCPVLTAAPQLKVLNFMKVAGLLKGLDAPPLEYLINRTLAATVMNFLFCVMIGLAAARHMSLRAATAFGVALTLCVELTQLTGIWGFYPCAYRQFNVDDLLMNALGVVAGAWIVSRWCRKFPVAKK